MPSLGERLKNSWNAFLGRDPTEWSGDYMYGGYSYRPDRVRLSRTSLRSIVSTIYNRIAVDVSQIDIRHVRLDDEDKYKETIDSYLDYTISKSANLDQTGRSMIRDVVISMFDEGCVAIVPIDTTENPKKTESYDIYSMRVGKITQWFPYEVRVELYEEQKMQKREIILPKRMVAIVENPFYIIMNEPNSIGQRLIRVLNQLDQFNDDVAARRLDMIVQLPYVAKSEEQQKRANQRQKQIEEQLVGSKYGVAYLDGTERVVQLNRPLENNLWEQAQEYTAQLYNELGLTQSIFDGTADEKTILNYYDRTIEPILSAITEEMERKWLSRTAISQKQAIRYFRDPFKLVPVSQIAEIADKFTRNEIMSSNELRSVIGLKPSDDPKADQLINANLNHTPEELEERGITKNIQNEEKGE